MYLQHIHINQFKSIQKGWISVESYNELTENGQHPFQLKTI